MSHVIIEGDCIQKLSLIESKTIDLVITDPPFNIGKKYGEGFSDNKRFDEYINWCGIWIKECTRVLKDTGSFYLINYPENNAYLLPFMQQNMIFKRWMTWHYPTNTGHSKTNYTRSQHSIIYCTKSKSSTFNRESILEPYKNPTDKRIQERIKNGKLGRAPYDVFQVNIVKNVSKEKTNHPCQIPIQLLQTFIKASSNENELVLDPFGGSFSTALAAQSLNRNSISIELNSEYVNDGKRRLNLS